VPITPPESESDPDPPQDGTSLLRELMSLQHELRALASDQSRLASLEARRAVTSLAKIVALTQIRAMVTFTAWLCLMALIFMFLTENDTMSLRGALLLLFAANGAITVLISVVIHKHSHHLRFPSTLNSLKGKSADSGEGS